MIKTLMVKIERFLELADFQIQFQEGTLTEGYGQIYRGYQAPSSGLCLYERVCIQLEIYSDRWRDRYGHK